MQQARRALYPIGLLLIAWAAIVATSGGVWIEWPPYRASSHDPVRPLVAGLAALVAFFLLTGRSRLPGEFRAIQRHGPAAAHAFALAAAIGMCVFEFQVGSFVASGADSYGYVSQADLWRQGSLHVPEPLARSLPWENALWTLAPLEYRPGLDERSIVPIGAPGLPILMAGVQLLTGSRCAGYAIFPLAAAAAVYAAFLIARALGGPWAGALAALLVAISPTFLIQSIFPATDVPVSAAWSLALAGAATRRGARAAVLAGLFSAAAIMIRPNLVLVAAPFGIFFLTDPDRASGSRYGWRPALIYSSCVMVAAAAIATIHTHLYGSPLQSGYGPLRDQYAWKSAVVNLMRYPRWALQAHAPVLLLALAFPMLLVGRWKLEPPQRRVVLLVAGVAFTIFVSYVFYTSFEDWWYLRFVLTAVLCAFVLVAVVFTRVLRPFAPSVRFAVLCTAAAAIFAYQAGYAVDNELFQLREVEHRYLDVAAGVARLTPDDAVIVTVQQSGTLRYYANRFTLRWDWLPADWLDGAVTEFQRRGRPVYFVIEKWEVPLFRERFGGSRLAALDWPPIAQYDGPMKVGLYDPLQRTPDRIPVMIPRTTALDCRRPFGRALTDISGRACVGMGSLRGCVQVRRAR